MIGERPLFPEYGEGGDYIGARRGRRAFRSFVAAGVLLAAMLAFAERYLQYDTAERLYQVALTLPPESARVFLRQAVRRDEQLHEKPTPKYLQALASREESEEAILDTYEKAYTLDKNNAAVAMRYGCRLFGAGDAARAAELFDTAARNDSQNVLPLYLKAAAQLRTSPDPDTLRDSLALVAQANNSGRLVTFPRPLWYSELPQRGVVYANLCREIVDECSRPLLWYANEIIRQAEEDLNAGRVGSWDSWLQTLEQMGERIAWSAAAGSRSTGDPPAGSAIQASLGIGIQLRALDQRLHVAKTEGNADTSTMTERRAKLDEALARLNAFENRRGDVIAKDRRGYLFPAYLCFTAAATFWLAYLVSAVMWRVLRRRPVRPLPAESDPERPGLPPPLPDREQDPERTLRHSRWVLAVLAGGAAMLLLTLFAVAGFQRSDAEEAIWIPAVRAAWWVEIVVLLIVGLAYPLLRLPKAADAARRGAAAEVQDDDLLRVARRLRRRAAFSLVNRYYGILAGSVLVVIAGWAVGYRLLVGLYPWQIELLTTGMVPAETEVVRQAIALLT